MHSHLKRQKKGLSKLLETLEMWTVVATILAQPDAVIGISCGVFHNACYDERVRKPGSVTTFAEHSSRGRTIEK